MEKIKTEININDFPVQLHRYMTNAEIYGISEALNSAFNTEERYLPARVNFFI